VLLCEALRILSNPLYFRWMQLPIIRIHRQASPRAGGTANCTTYACSRNSTYIRRHAFITISAFIFR
jgi:hypothetical protein